MNDTAVGQPWPARIAVGGLTRSGAGDVMHADADSKARDVWDAFLRAWSSPAYATELSARHWDALRWLRNFGATSWAVHEHGASGWCSTVRVAREVGVTPQAVRAAAARGVLVLRPGRGAGRPLAICRGCVSVWVPRPHRPHRERA